jgi:uncharacterized protein YraI
MKKILLVLALLTFFSPAYASPCLSNNTSPIERTTKASSFKVSDINLRSGAGMQHCIVRVLNDAKNKPVTIKGKSGSWTQIIFDDKDYWIHGSLLN